VVAARHPAWARVGAHRCSIWARIHSWACHRRGPNAGRSD
jgi:hypothetical protein